MPNPFHLRGPEFLIVYTLLGVLVVATVVVLRRRPERPASAGGPLPDYLRIAYLRGGADEALRVAALALIDRQLLKVVDVDRLEAVGNPASVGLLRTEQRLLEACRRPVDAREVLSDAGLKVTARLECEANLARAGLLPDASVRTSRTALVLGAWLVLGGVALVKILIALNAGRTNVGFLITACILFGYAAYSVASPFRTAAGDAMLGDLRTLFDGLRDRSVSITMPSGSNEVALLAAVFGVGAVSGGPALLRTLFRKPQSDSSSAVGCGSSCGSSCGGGCGGGCGGCGS